MAAFLLPHRNAGIKSRYVRQKVQVDEIEKGPNRIVLIENPLSPDDFGSIADAI